MVHEKDNLLKKLVDIEQEGKEASYELNKLKDTCRKLKKVNRFNTYVDSRKTGKKIFSCFEIVLPQKRLLWEIIKMNEIC